MRAYEAYLTAKRNEDAAREVLGKIGAQEHTTSPRPGYLHSLSVSAVVHHQYSDGAKNYHDDKNLDAALSEAARQMWPEMRRRAEEILAAKTREALVKSKVELEVALADVSKAEAA